MSDTISRDYMDNIEAAELQNEENPNYVTTNLEFQKWKIDPVARGKFEDINKDSVLANLNKSEMLEIKFIEAAYAGMVAIKNQFPFGIRDFFVPDEVKEPALRRKYSTLALSNSKDGFRLKIDQSKILYKTTSESKESEQKKSGFNFLNRKAKTTQEE
jgi:hypothetical protein